jgi:hypothetical protein
MANMSKIRIALASALALSALLVGGTSQQHHAAPAAPAAHAYAGQMHSSGMPEECCD